MRRHFLLVSVQDRKANIEGRGFFLFVIFDLLSWILNLLFLLFFLFEPNLIFAIAKIFCSVYFLLVIKLVLCSFCILCSFYNGLLYIEKVR